ncbi:MAG: DUF3581 domain-containing protein [Natronospirillum sp.]|uniref:DUF3581 family protein n=1 Tax=Natronospirillum sp. TaxID=2812955 RepID=UPI0025EF1D36|nr:DUF3581 family protein [Natronospirillum sp.]MCH8550762.1 DUF3581 domain-containing protein [Natronospirillum sp.]
MFLDPYFTRDGEQIIISAAQGSAFAKQIAGDFNPIHDPDNRRFCVPGDLLFSLALNRYGLSRSMAVHFAGMVDADQPVVFPDSETAEQQAIEVRDQRDKMIMHIDHSGETLHNPALLESFTREYVKFSGQNFPYILVPLLREHNVMFNPKRPFVIYERMSFELNTIDLAEPHLELADRTLTVNGRRGDTQFLFRVLDGDKEVGRGAKTLIVSGLQPYDEEQMQVVVTNFNAAKAAYQEG